MPIFKVKFRPAEYHSKGKNVYVCFYVEDPKTGCLKRISQKLNHIKDAPERRRYAEYVCHSINEKLYSGWNPLAEDSFVPETSVISAFKMFMDDKACLRTDSLRSYRSYNRILLNWCESCGLSEKSIGNITKTTAKSFMASVVSGKSARTYNNYLHHYQTVFNYFVDSDIVKNNPFADIKPRITDSKIRKIIPKNIRKNILEYYQSNNMPEFIIIMQLCYQCLIRPKEIRMLKIKNIDFENMVIDLPASISKNHHERIIPLHGDMWDYIQKLKHLDKNCFVFSSGFKPGKKQMGIHAIGKAWVKMRESIGLSSDYQFYSLKDTGITEMLEAGVPPKLVKELADHHSLEMTERYTHKSDPKKILEWGSLEF